MKRKPKQKETSFLTKDQNEDLFSLLGKERFTLSTTLVRLLLSESPKHFSWQIWCTGIACLVKDYEMKTFYICVYDFVEKKMLWTQNMVDVFELKSPQNLFLMFKSNDYSVGLQFVNESEGQHFTDLLRQLVDKKSELWRDSQCRRQGSIKRVFKRLFTRPGKSKKLVIVHNYLADKEKFESDVIYSEVLCKPKARPCTFDNVIVNNLFKPIEKIHPPIPRRFARL